MSTGACFAIQPAARLHAELMARAAGEGNDHVLACMIASWQTGEGAMPDWLGLRPACFRSLMDHHFVGADIAGLVAWGRGVVAGREEETDELVRLMLGARAGVSPSEVWIAQVVAAGCMAADHLWQDLGLWCRGDLTALMRRNFPPLAERNVKDMKWKRFLYKQLCATQGVFTCRAPTCGTCSDYPACFGAEG